VSVGLGDGDVVGLVVGLVVGDVGGLVVGGVVGLVGGFVVGDSVGHHVIGGSHPPPSVVQFAVTATSAEGIVNVVVPL